MKFLREIFLFSLFVFILTNGVQAGPKRFFDGKLKNDPHSLTTAEQTEHSREQEEREEASEPANEVDEENSWKTARVETMPQIAEGFFETAVPSEASMQVSTSAPANLTALVRLLWTIEPPTLYQLALARLMKLPAGHPTFSKGLPPQLYTELIDPCQDSMEEIIRELHQACLERGVYRLPKEEQQKNAMIAMKEYFQKQCTMSKERLRSKEYPSALFLIVHEMMNIPHFKEGAYCWKEQAGFKKEKERILAFQNYNTQQAKLFDLGIEFLSKKKKFLFELIRTKKEMSRKILLTELPADEIKFAQQEILSKEKLIAIITPIIEQQKTFLAQLEQFTREQQENAAWAYASFLKFVNVLDETSLLKNQKESRLLIQQLTTWDQIMKVAASTDPEVQKLAQKIGEVNKNLVLIATKTMEAKIEQSQISLRQQGRLTISPNGERKSNPESCAAIFQLYEIPLISYEKVTSLLAAAREDFLVGRKELSDRKLRLAYQWELLAKNEEEAINLLSQLDLVHSPEDFLNTRFIQSQETFEVQQQLLIDQEVQLAVEGGRLPIDLSIGSLPWDFEKTFEENVAALHRFEL